MSNFAWKDEYCLEVQKMDDEHKGLLIAMEKLHDACHLKADRKVIGKAIENLADLTVRHFQDEEKHMESIKFPDITIHKAMHKKLLDQFSEHVNLFKSGQDLDKKFFDFLYLWISSHIMHNDMKYSKKMSKKAG